VACADRFGEGHGLGQGTQAELAPQCLAAALEGVERGFALAQPLVQPHDAAEVRFLQAVVGDQTMRLAQRATHVAGVGQRLASPLGDLAPALRDAFPAGAEPIGERRRRRQVEAAQQAAGVEVEDTVGIAFGQGRGEGVEVGRDAGREGDRLGVGREDLVEPGLAHPVQLAAQVAAGVGVALLVPEQGREPAARRRPVDREDGEAGDRSPVGEAQPCTVAGQESRRAEQVQGEVAHEPGRDAGCRPRRIMAPPPLDDLFVGRVDLLHRLIAAGGHAQRRQRRAGAVPLRIVDRLEHLAQLLAPAVADHLEVGFLSSMQTICELCSAPAS
jgi:hypothetical protein